VRNDNGVYSGYTVPVFYDPMLSKLICHAATRAETIARMKRALIEYRVEGIETTIPFFTALMEHPSFVDAQFDTGFLDRNLAELTKERGADRDVEAAIAAAAILAFEESQLVRLPEQNDSPWKRAGRIEALKDLP
jgi:acetyl-CoA carboxylase biotin carboxylase subunit